MAITERLYQFDTKATLAATDILFCGNASDSFNEVQSTVAGLIGAYPDILSVALGNGLPGTLTNNNAAAGIVGELDSSIVLIGAAVALTTGATADITSLVLQPGDYDVWAEVWTTPGAGTTTASIACGINTTTVSIPSVPSLNSSKSSFNVALAANVDAQLPISSCRISVATATTTTVYLSINAVFGVSTLGAFGKIMARRRR